MIVSLCDLPFDIFCRKLLPYRIPDPNLFSPLANHINHSVLCPYQHSLPKRPKLDSLCSLRHIACHGNLSSYAKGFNHATGSLKIISRCNQVWSGLEGLILPQSIVRHYSTAYSGFRNKMRYNSTVCLPYWAFDTVFHEHATNVRLFQHLQNASPASCLTNLYIHYSCPFPPAHWRKSHDLLAKNKWVTIQ